MTRKNFTAEQKFAFLAEHLEKQVSVADLGKAPHTFKSVLPMEKKLYENAVDILSSKRGCKKKSAKIIRLPATVA